MNETPIQIAARIQRLTQKEFAELLNIMDGQMSDRTDGAKGNPEAERAEMEFHAASRNWTAYTDTL